MHVTYTFTFYVHDDQNILYYTNSLLEVQERFLYVDFKSLCHSNSNCCMILQSNCHTPIHYTG